MNLFLGCPTGNIAHGIVAFKRHRHRCRKVSLHKASLKVLKVSLSEESCTSSTASTVPATRYERYEMYRARHQQCLHHRKKLREMQPPTLFDQSLAIYLMSSEDDSSDFEESEVW